LVLVTSQSMVALDQLHQNLRRYMNDIGGPLYFQLLDLAIQPDAPVPFTRISPGS